jgi:Ser/Thr protein kinase RdoA (MazF antagonist)
MNDTWLIDLGDRRRVLRRHRRTGRDEVEFEHAVMAAARAGGVPCPETFTARNGSALVEDGGRLHSLYSWAPGVQRTRQELSPAHAASTGATLALTQIALHEHSNGPWRPDRPFDLGAVDVHLARLAATIRSRPDADQVAWLAADVD